MDHARETTLENFASVMDLRETDFKATMEKFTDQDLAQVINMYGRGDKPRGVYLVESVLRTLAAYKMQLFLYIKASGNTSINSSNLWAGVDMPAK
jgi:hypothetical protein